MTSALHRSLSNGSGINVASPCKLESSSSRHRISCRDFNLSTVASFFPNEEKSFSEEHEPPVEEPRMLVIPKRSHATRLLSAGINLDDRLASARHYSGDMEKNDAVKLINDASVDRRRLSSLLAPRRISIFSTIFRQPPAAATNHRSLRSLTRNPRSIVGELVVDLTRNAFSPPA